MLVPWIETTPRQGTSLGRVSLGKGRPKRTEIIRSETPDSECSSYGGHSRILPFEHTIGSQGVLLLTDCLAFDDGNTLSEELLLLVLGNRLDLELEEVVLVLDPLSDLLPSESNLTRSVVEVKDRRVGLEGNLTPDGQNTLARGRDGSASLIAIMKGEYRPDENGNLTSLRRRRGEGDDTADGSTNLEGSLGAHDNLDTTALGLHELWME